MKQTFTDDDARRAWDEGARAFDHFVETGADYYRRLVHGPALLAACQPVSGRTALDLGTGQGYFARELARAGARVTAIDLSPELIRFAKEHEAREALGIEYHVMSAAGIARGLSGEAFDVVASCMAIQDMADVPSVLAAAAAVMRPDGHFVFSVPHPCTETPYREWERHPDGTKKSLRIDRYFDSGPAVCNWNMPRLSYHWDTPFQRFTIGEWSAMIDAVGFVIRRLHEPRPTTAQLRQQPRLDDCSRLPYFLIFDVIKREPGPARSVA
jgi:2-polyprenyl-3-methyl-5-hydroxy-6-metoxy-1,4-benzoquinol methylase